MKKLFLFCLLLASLSLSAQQTKLDIRQIESLPLDHFMVGTGSTNITLERTAANIIVVPQNGISSTNAQSALEELQSEIDAVAAGASDGVVSGGSFDEVNEKIDFTVDAPGTDFSVSVSDLALDDDIPTNVSQLTNDAGYITSPIDADASVTNEVQEPTDNINDNVIGLTLTATDISRADAMEEETFAPTSGNTVTLSISPDASKDISVTLNGQELYFTAIAAGTPDLGLSANIVTFNHWTFSAGDIVRVKYAK